MRQRRQVGELMRIMIINIRAMIIIIKIIAGFSSSLNLVSETHFEPRYLFSVFLLLGGCIYQFSPLIDDLISHTAASCRRTARKIILYLHNQSRRCKGGASSPSLPLSFLLSPLAVVSQSWLRWLTSLINAGFILLSCVQQKKSL